LVRNFHIKFTSKIHHHIRPDLVTPAAAISLKRLLRAGSPAQFASFHFVTSLNLPLLGKLSSWLAELAENQKD
jgi:hypothetical protein